MMTPYAELAVTTNFSFLRGASHAEELVVQAKALGLSAIGVADRNTLAGVVRAHSAAKHHGMRLLVGARLVPEDGPDLICYPTDRAAYGRLSALLSKGKLAAEKGECRITLSDIEAHSEGQVFICLPPEGIGPRFEATLTRLARLWPGRLYLAGHFAFRGRDRERLARLADLGATAGAPLIAINNVLYHAPNRRPLQDVMTCIREHCTIHEAGFRLEANAERHLKSPKEMARLLAGFEPALARTVELVERCRFSLDELAYEYPDEPVPEGSTPQRHLEYLTWKGADWRYPSGVPETVEKALHKELALIRELNYAPYFLTVHDIVAWARGQGILCQGRGSAANSAVCFCLGITSVDPAKTSLLFERFLSRERREPPDIDVDFEHERREEVIQYVYRRYGRHRAALTATVISYRPRSAVREVCKAMGLSEDIATAMAGTVWGSWGSDINEPLIRQAGLDPKNPVLRQAIALTRQLIGFPRHLSQHVGGFVLTRGPLSETVPIGNAAMNERTFIEWDKDDIEALGIMKVDVLALGMLTCIRKAFDMLALYKGLSHTLASVPQGDAATYDMLCVGDSLGVFQVESRAQMNMLPRLRPRCFYDLVIEVAIVRPGPIQGDMVHPYLRRRQAKETVSYPSPSPAHGPPDELEKILKRTLGVPLFQEQAMQISIDAAKFTPDEANGLRRAMATFRKVGTIQNYEEMMVNRMVERGYDAEFAQRCFDQVKGFGEYGFPESHAASFALLVYVSSWLKCHHPDVFCAALLNSQPMGFYAPAQIVRDAIEHGVEVRPVDVNLSDWDNGLEPCLSDPRSGFACAMDPAQGCGLPDPRSGSACAVACGGETNLHDAPPLPLAGEGPGEGASDASTVNSQPSPSHAFGAAPSLSRDRERESHAPHPKSRAPQATAQAQVPPPPAANGTEQSEMCTVRLGFRQVDGVREDEMEALMAHRFEGYSSVAELRQRAGLSARSVELLAAADAFRSMGLDRRAALWAAKGEAREKALPLFAAADVAEQGAEAETRLPEMPTSEHVIQDYQTTRLSLKDHPMGFLRERYGRLGIVSTAEATAQPNGAKVRCAGVVLVRQRPGSANGVFFVTLEDETGIANLVVWPRVGERFRPVLMGARIMIVKGRVQTADHVTHIVADEIIDRTSDLSLLSEDAQRDPLAGVLARADHGLHPLPSSGQALAKRLKKLASDDPLRGMLANADEVKRPVPERSSAGRHPRNLRIIPKSRDFH
jgi:error-prone DNA polymerase